MKARPGWGFLKSHPSCVVCVAQLGERWWDMAHGGRQFEVVPGFWWDLLSLPVAVVVLFTEMGHELQKAWAVQCWAR